VVVVGAVVVLEDVDDEGVAARSNDGRCEQAAATRQRATSRGARRGMRTTTSLVQRVLPGERARPTGFSDVEQV
jgi:hypothetical protein